MEKKKRSKKPKDLDERYYYCFVCWKNDRLKFWEIQKENYIFYCTRCQTIIGDLIEENRIMNIPPMNEMDHVYQSWTLTPYKWKQYCLTVEGKYNDVYKYWIDDKGNLQKNKMSNKDLREWSKSNKKLDKEEEQEENENEGEDYENQN